MHDALLVGVLQCGCGLPADLGHESPEIPAERRPVIRVLQLAVERAAVDELHREIERALIIADLVHRHDVVVPEACRRLSFVEETADVPAIEGGTAGEHLQGDGSLEPFVEGLVDDPHAASADLSDDSMAADAFRTHRRLGDIWNNAMQAKQSLEAGPQSFRVVWMAGQHVFHGRRVSPAESLSEVVNDGEQLLVSHAGGLCRVSRAPIPAPASRASGGPLRCGPCWLPPRRMRGPGMSGA